MFVVIYVHCKLEIEHIISVFIIVIIIIIILFWLTSEVTNSPSVRLPSFLLCFFTAALGMMSSHAMPPLYLFVHGYFF